LRPAPGVKVNRFTALSDDLALALKAKSIRIQAPIPGRGLIGIELPNIDRDVIYLRDVLLSDEMNAIKSPLGIALGKDISGRPVVGELTKMPHLLVAGATGSGKSVCINTIITSLILKKRPDELRLILIDPKRVELAPYAAIPHLIGSVVTDPERALENLQWAEEEMERRYRCLQDLKVRDIASYNEKVTKLKAKAEEAGIEPDHYLLPFIVIVVDEFADLIMTAGRDVELPITRLAQKARAVGIHLILATQRPSRKVITGLIKANFPSRIAFQVSSRVESSIILDTIGAEKLLGRGDMLYLPAGTALAERVHGCFVSDQEVEELCDYLSQQPKPVEIKVKREIEDSDLVMDYDDDLFPDAARLVVENNMASVSMLQRHFKIGYARAGRLIDLLEKAGIIGPHLGSKSRDVIAKEEDLDRYGL
jgi:S-DNA-T family DNA segregation ATPase FtsK/SpoIIIE